MGERTGPRPGSRLLGQVAQLVTDYYHLLLSRQTVTPRSGGVLAGDQLAQ